MVERFKHKQIRLYNWDYRWAASYFVTICTKNREHYFGSVKDKRMVLSNIGIIADILWHETKHHVNHIELGSFVVMPNHVHGIVIIKNDFSSDTGRTLNLNENKITGQNRFQNIGKRSLSSIIGSYKSAVSKHCNRLGLDFAWQRRFHDNIIRNREQYIRVAKYIENNPKKWGEDRFK
jgi:REP element-mobilizing transposase RayT